MNRSDTLAPIDFVILWVDGSDPAWLAEKNRYLGSSIPTSYVSDSRYADWDTLKYIFRGIESFTPWVNTVHFVTWGHLPKWLNVNHPKLHIVRHEDFLPEEYRPTFNSNTLVVNLHRIPQLSEQFVLFNDDMFIIRETPAEMFFKDGLPRSTAALFPNMIIQGDWFYAPLNNMAVLSNHFNPRKAVFKHPLKWFNFKSGLLSFATLYSLPLPFFFGMHEAHGAYSYLKSTFEEVWEKEFEELDKTSRCHFRESTNLSDWLMEAWQHASGTFIPRSRKFSQAFFPGKNFDNAYNCIREQKASVVCVNDGKMSDSEREVASKELASALAAILPAKSSFEL